MPFQDLPPEVLVAIYGWSDSFRTATALSATNRYLNCVWTSHTKVILQNITRVVLPNPREAGLLADRYEETHNNRYHARGIVRPASDEVESAISRAMLLTDELRILRQVVAFTSREYATSRLINRSNSVISSILAQPETFLKQAYRAMILVTNHTCQLFHVSPTSFPRKVFQTMRMSDLKFVQVTVCSLGEYFRQRTRDFAPVMVRNPNYVSVEHFWPDPLTRSANRKAPFIALGLFLSALFSHLSCDALYPGVAINRNSPAILAGLMMQVEQWQDRVKDHIVDEILASASFCRLEGDRWIINCGCCL